MAEPSTHQQTPRHAPVQVGYKGAPTLLRESHAERLLRYEANDNQRCSLCILPTTMPFIKFDDRGVCNYCHAYVPRNGEKSRKTLDSLLATYRRDHGPDVIVPFSGGRDSTAGLHYIVKELELTPVTYFYDWGMVTDLGRRNVAKVTSQLGVRSLTIEADIPRKRRNISKNLTAWLKQPNLGMLNILTAGDKHFFRLLRPIQESTGINLNLWAINPLEVTHFKSGFLGIAPDFLGSRVYSNGLTKQAHYQALRFGAMFRNPAYFNSSLWDTLSGEYFRSFARKTDYFHLFDYWQWDEHAIETILDDYDWERADDTTSSWRIGDGTAGFFNYVYYTAAGFTENDTFRSNQIREGQITREEALALVADENRPRYQSIKWYLDILGFSFRDVIKTVNEMPMVLNRTGRGIRSHE